MKKGFQLFQSVLKKKKKSPQDILSEVATDAPQSCKEVHLYSGDADRETKFIQLVICLKK